MALTSLTRCVCAQTADREQNPRGINRHKFSLEEAEAATQQPVVQALFDLCRFRNEHKAFNGKVGRAAVPPSRPACRCTRSSSARWECTVFPRVLHADALYRSRRTADAQREVQL